MGFFGSFFFWQIFKWFLTTSNRAKALSHCSHLKFLVFSCFAFMWRFSAFFEENCSWQDSQSYRMLAWILTWSFRLRLELNCFSQVTHYTTILFIPVCLLVPIYSRSLRKSCSTFLTHLSHLGQIAEVLDFCNVQAMVSMFYELKRNILDLFNWYRDH